MRPIVRQLRKLRSRLTNRGLRHPTLRQQRLIERLGETCIGDCHADVFLRQHGFKLLNLYDLWTQEDGQLTAGDAVYLNTRYF